MGSIIQALFIGGTVGLLMVIGIFALIPIAAGFYILESTFRTHIPTGIMFARWGAKGRIYIPLIVLVIILIMLMILCLLGFFVTLTNDLDILAWLLLLLFFIFAAIAVVPVLILLFGTLAWITRLIMWIFRLWSALIDRIFGGILDSIKMWLVINYLRLLIWIERSPQRRAPAYIKAAPPSVATEKSKTAMVTRVTRPTPEKQAPSVVKKPTAPPEKHEDKAKPAKKTAMDRFGDSVSAQLEAFRYGGKRKKQNKSATKDSQAPIKKVEDSGEAKKNNAQSTESVKTQQEITPKPTQPMTKPTTEAVKKQPDTTIPPQKPSSAGEPPDKSIPVQKPAPPPTQSQITPEQPETTGEVKMSWRDRQLIRMMTSPRVIKIMSKPIVVKGLTKMTVLYLGTSTRLSRKNKKKINLNIK